MGPIVQVEDVGDWQRSHAKVHALSQIAHAAETGRQQSEAALDEALRGIADRCQELLPPPPEADLPRIEVKGSAMDKSEAPAVPAGSKPKAEAGDPTLAGRIAGALEAEGRSMSSGELANEIPMPKGVASFDGWRVSIRRAIAADGRFETVGKGKLTRYRLR